MAMFGDCIAQRRRCLLTSFMILTEMTHKTNDNRQDRQKSNNEYSLLSCREARDIELIMNWDALYICPCHDIDKITRLRLHAQSRVDCSMDGDDKAC